MDLETLYNGGRRRMKGSSVCVTLRCRNHYLTDLACGSWDTQLGEEWQLSLARRARSQLILWLACVAPLWLGGLRGKKSTPSIGWEVPVNSRRSASGSCTEHVGLQLRVGDQATVCSLHFCMVYCCRIYAWICMFNGVSKLIVQIDD